VGAAQRVRQARLAETFVVPVFSLSDAIAVGEKRFPAGEQHALIVVGTPGRQPQRHAAYARQLEGLCRGSEAKRRGMAGADAFVEIEALAVPEEDPDARWRM
jgi:hypothetical protein